MSLFAAAAIVASLAYRLYGRRVPFWLADQLSIVAGVLSTLAYWGLTGKCPPSGHRRIGPDVYDRQPDPAGFGRSRLPAESRRDGVCRADGVSNLGIVM